MKNLSTLLFILISFFASAQTKPLDKQLFSAIKQSRHQKVDSLIKLGADIHAVDSTSATTLMVAAYESDVEMVKLLVKYGADAKKKGLLPVHRTTKDFYYGSVLTAAAGEGKTSIVTYLIDSLKLAVDERELTPDGGQGMTALMRACEWGKQRCIEYLIRKGADPNITHQEKNSLQKSIENLDLFDFQYFTKNDDIILSLLKLTKFSNYNYSYLHEIIDKIKYTDYEKSKSFIKNILTSFSDSLKYNIDESTYDLNSFKTFNSLFFWDNLQKKDSTKAVLSKSQFQFEKAFTALLESYTSDNNSWINNYYYLNKYDSLLKDTPNRLKLKYFVSACERSFWVVKNYSKTDSINNLVLENYKAFYGNNSLSYANALFEQGKLKARQYNYKLAIQLINQAIKISEELLDSNKIGQTQIGDLFYNLGFCYNANSDMTNANYCLSKATLIAKRFDIKRLEINCLKIISQNNYRIGKLDSAITGFKKIISYQQEYEPKQEVTLAYSYNDIGMCYENKGNISESEYYRVKCIDILSKYKHQEHAFNSLLTAIGNLGAFYSNIGLIEKAKQTFDSGIKLHNTTVTKSSNDNLFTIIHNLIGLKIKTNDTINIDSLSRLMIELAPKSRIDHFAAIIKYAHASLMRGKVILADSLINYAIVELKKIDDVKKAYHISNALVKKADIRFRMQKSEIEYLTDLTSILKDIEIIEGKGSKNYQNLTQRVNTLKLKTNYPLDTIQLREAINYRLEYFANNIVGFDENIQLDFLESEINSFHFYQSILVNQNIMREYFHKLSYITKNIILTNVSTLHTKKFEDINIEAKKNKLLQLRNTIVKLSNDDFKDNSKTIKTLSNNLNKLHNELIIESKVYEKYVSSLDNSFANFKEKLNDNELLIDITHFKYHNGKKWTDSTLYCASIIHPTWSSPKTVVLFEEKQLQQYLEQSVKLEDDKTINEIYNSKNQFLTTYIYQKLTPFLTGVQTIYFSPSGLFNRIAFGAIPINKKQRIVDKFAIKQITSPRELEKKTDDKSIAEWKDITLYGGIKYDSDSSKLIQTLAMDAKKSPLNSIAIRGKTRGGSWDSLTNSRLEIQHIKKIFTQTQTQVTTKTDFFANEESVKKLGESGNSPEIIHFATHGFSYAPQKEVDTSPGFESVGNTFKNSENSLLRSGIVLAGANRVWSGKPALSNADDGILTSMEISNLDLYNTKLVVMSACESALGDIKGNEGVFGLQRAFKIAGVKYTISSLWRIPDKETAEFMTDFYSNLAQKQDIETAFSNTQKTMRTKYSPYYWAAFVLVK